MAYLWWGRANKGKTEHLWVDDETLCGLKQKTRHPWLHGARRCSKCLSAFSNDLTLQTESARQEREHAARRQRFADMGRALRQTILENQEPTK